MDDEHFGVITEKGLFLYLPNQSLNSPKGSIVWTESFQLENVIFEQNCKHIFILGDQGNLRMTRICTGVTSFHSLDLVRSNCISIGKVKGGITLETTLCMCPVVCVSLQKSSKGCYPGSCPKLLS